MATGGYCTFRASFCGSQSRSFHDKSGLVFVVGAETTIWVSPASTLASFLSYFSAEPDKLQHS